MAKHLQREIERLKRLLLQLSALVEENLWRAVQCVERRNPGLAKNVIDLDERIDQMEMDVEEECLKILALHQPVASDLRLIVAMLKMNNDLERVGDLASNIAKQAIFLTETGCKENLFDFSAMASKVRAMLKGSLDALVNFDRDLAEQICKSDDDVDEMDHEVYQKVAESLRQQPGNTEQILCHLSISRHLERIADLATNIAEDVIYMIGGKIHRHGVERSPYNTSQ